MIQPILREVSDKVGSYRKAGRRPKSATKVMKDSTSTAVTIFLIKVILGDLT